jgi:hypothetical protein
VKGLSNRTKYEQYRSQFDSGCLKADPPAHILADSRFLSTLVELWRLRYYRRQAAIHFVPVDKDVPRLADTVAKDLLIARARARNSLYTTLPDWPAEQVASAERDLSKAHVDVSTLLDIPSYGPSLVSLWVDAKQQGLSDDDAARNVWLWANRPGLKWKRDDARRAKGLPAIEPKVQKRLAEVTVWRQTGDLYLPWDAGVAGHHWQVRLNDFPDEWVYSLLVDGAEVGDFHDWPQAWDRGEARPAPKERNVPVAARPVANIDPKTLLSRYRNGECEEVWRDLMALGGEVRKARYKNAAWAVARETMWCAGQNVRLLVKRLKKLEYRFLAQAGQVFRPFRKDELGLFRACERKGLWIPLSLRAWAEEVGQLDLTGSHPALGPVNERGEPAVHTDPLDFSEPFALEGVLEEWLAPSPPDRQPIQWEVGLDASSKAGMVTNEEPSGGYEVRLPNLAADAVLEGESHGITFVEYLRLSFRWGGFPGWEKHERRPEKELAFLREGLIPI